MEALAAVLGLLVVVVVLFEVAGRIGVPYPTLLILGGLALAFVPGLPHLVLQPDLVLLVFLPPLLFAAAFETSLRDLRANIGPIGRLSIGLVLFTIVVVAAVTRAAIPALDWAAAFTLGAIVAPTDALAATTVFRRLGVPARVVTILEGEGLLNDAAALIAYRTAVVVTMSGTVVLSQTAVSFVVAGLGGIALGALAAFVGGAILGRLDDPPVEVAISLVIPFAAYLPADQLGLSGVLAAVTAGLVLGRRSATIFTPDSRVLGTATWQMVTFILNGFAFILIGLELPQVLAGLAGQPAEDLIRDAVVVSATVIVARFVWVFITARLTGSAIRLVPDRDPRLAKGVTFLVAWSGLRGAVSLAAALALPAGFPARDLILLLAFAVILATLVGQGLTLPFVARGLGLRGLDAERREETLAREAAGAAGLAAAERLREVWPAHLPLLDGIRATIEDQARHLATADPDETRERDQERVEHEAIRREVLAAERGSVIDLRDRGEISDEVLRTIERELDLEELRMQA